MRRACLLLLLLLYPHLCTAADFVLAFDNVPPPWTLKSLRIVDGHVTQAEEPLTALPTDACQKLDPAYQARTVCARVACVPDSFYLMYVTGKDEPPTNTIAFGTDAACGIRDAEAAYAEALQPEEKPVLPASIPTEAEAAPIPDERDAVPSPALVPSPAAPVAEQPTQPVSPQRPPVEAAPARPVATHPPPQPQPTPQPRPRPVVVPPGTNLIPAPTAAQPWRSGSFAGTQTQTGLDTRMQRHGHPVQRLTGRGDYFAQTTTPPFAVESGRTYDVSAWVKLEKITKLVEVDVFYCDAQGNQLRAWGEAIGGRRKGTHDWTPIQGQVTIPPGAVTAVIQVRVMSRGGQAWVDDVQMRAQAGVGIAAPPRDPEVIPAQPSTGVGTEAPPRDPEVMPAQPRLPAKPEAPAPLPAPVPAQTEEELRAQFARLGADYLAAQGPIRATYAATLQRLAKDHTPAAQQEREQAHAQGTQALTALYETLVKHWDVLTAAWKEVL